MRRPVAVFCLLLLPLAPRARADDAASDLFAGDFGYPVHDGHAPVGTGFARRLDGPAVDVAGGKETQVDQLKARDSKTRVVTKSDQALLSGGTKVHGYGVG